jgi:ribulose-phosphate 3-epimerase
MALEYRVCPTILAADFMRLGEVVKELADAGMRHLHLDVMDGHYVPNIVGGTRLLEDVRKLYTGVIDTHLMVTNPLEQAKLMIEAGSDIIIFQPEQYSGLDAPLFADAYLHEVIAYIRQQGKLIGIGVNGSSAVEIVEPYVSEVDMVLIAGNQLGWAGKPFEDKCYEKIRRVRAQNASINIMVDMGVNLQTLPLIKQAGANWFGLSSVIINHPDGIAAGFKQVEKLAFS